MLSVLTINNPSGNFPSVRPSFIAILQEVKVKVDFESFPPEALYEEICKIITETLFLNPSNEIKIAGELLPVQLVQEIFAQLTHEHIEMVAENFGSVTKIINNTKAYLRTALYNSIFELDAHYSNKVRHDMVEGAAQ